MQGILALKMEPMGRLYKKCKESVKWWFLRIRPWTLLGAEGEPRHQGDGARPG